MPINENPLPREAQEILDLYAAKGQAIRWVHPGHLSRGQLDHKIKEMLFAFGIQATPSYRRLRDNHADWSSASFASRFGRPSPEWHRAESAIIEAMARARWQPPIHREWDRTWRVSKHPAYDSALQTAWRKDAQAASFDFAAMAISDLVLGTLDALAAIAPDKTNFPNPYTSIYPTGSYTKLVELWELGLYPCGLSAGTFICYVPDGAGLLEEDPAY